MKTINQLTHTEKLALTDEQIDKMVQLKLAEECIPLKFSSPEKPDRETTIKKTVKAYKCKGFIFKDKEQAMKFRNFVSDLETYKETYDYNISYSYQWIESCDEDISVSEVEYYSERDVRDNVDAIKNWSSVEERYEKQKREWGSFRSKYRSVYDEIWGEIKSARNLQAEADRMKQLWNEYLQLADNDFGKAQQFFFKAHNPSQEVRTLAGL